MLKKIVYRLLETHADYRRAEEVQRTVWGFADREIIPLNDLVPTQKIGGWVFGAFDQMRLIGLCVGTPGIKKGKPYHYSRIMGVLPEFQEKGIGYALKLFQRDLCLKQGLDLVRWTFDPLQSRNAFFNLEKLGVVVREYSTNIYGDFSSSRFNSGLETDRFIPEWNLRSRRVKERIRAPIPRPDLEEITSDRGHVAGIKARLNTAGLLEPEVPRPPRKSPARLYVEIPADIDAIKARDLALARAWRAATREFFVDAFDRRYVITGFAADPAGSRRAGAYILQRGFSLK